MPTCMCLRRYKFYFKHLKDNFSRLNEFLFCLCRSLTSFPRVTIIYASKFYTIAY